MLTKNSQDAVVRLQNAAIQFGIFAASKGVRYNDEKGRPHFQILESSISELTQRMNDISRERAVLSVSDYVGFNLNRALFNFDDASEHYLNFLAHNMFKFPALIPASLGRDYFMSTDIPHNNEYREEYYRMEALNFGFALERYMHQALKYTVLDWDQKPIKRDSFDYVPGDRKKNTKPNVPKKGYLTFLREYFS